MTIPTSKQEFKGVIYTQLGFPIPNLSGFFSVFLYGGRELDYSIKTKIKDCLENKMGLKNPNLPSNLITSCTVSQYLDEIWNLNKSFFEIRLPEPHDPKSRENFMGRSISRQQNIVDWLEQTEASEDWNNGWFKELPYQERKYLMPVRSFEDYETNTPDIKKFRISHIPEDVKFQDCLPIMGELYIAHPYKPGVYLPASRYEHLLFRERIHELSKVMMALGATEIRTLLNSGARSYSKEDLSSRTSASGSVGIWASGNGSHSSSSTRATNAETEEEIVINSKNDPIKLPYIPEGLVWFSHENEWQQIADSRLNGNILEYEIRLSSKQVNLVSDSERNNIEAQARILLASGSFSRETTSASIFKEERAKSTSILIKFKSRKDY